MAHPERVHGRQLWPSETGHAQERRAAAPIVCTYIGRSDHDGRPFRFLLNNSKAAATNVYRCLYPQPALANLLRHKPEALRLLWEGLNAIGKEKLLGSGRVYGGGMHKLEPKELANVPADDLAAMIGLSNKPAGQVELEEILAG